MSGLFDSIGISGSGLIVDRQWLDAISDNLSNVNDTAPGDKPVFAQRYIDAQAAPGGGTQTVGVRYGDSTGTETYDPQNPIADAKGYVRHTDVDMSDQMTQMMMAQRGYEANLQVISRATQAYQQALQLGK